MLRRNYLFPYVSILFLIWLSCSNAGDQSAVGEGGWLSGNSNRKFETVAKHLRGFDMAMVETGHRYAELYWACRDKNWGYAEYQAQKIRLAIENGLERRPKRAASAEPFLKVILPEVEKVIAARDSASFSNLFGALTSACNTCHVAEKVNSLL